MRGSLRGSRGCPTLEGGSKAGVGWSEDQAQSPRAAAHSAQGSAVGTGLGLFWKPGTSPSWQGQQEGAVVFMTCSPPAAPAPGGDLEVPPAAAAALLGSDLVATPASAPQPEPPEACLSLATVPAVEALEPPASPEAKPEPEHPQPWFTKRRWPWGRRRGQRTISNQDRPHRRSPSWVRTLLSCLPIHSSGPRSGPSHE